MIKAAQMRAAGAAMLPLALALMTGGCDRRGARQTDNRQETTAAPGPAVHRVPVTPQRATAEQAPAALDNGTDADAPEAEAAPSQVAGPAPLAHGSLAFLKVDGGWQRGWFICDGTDRPQLIMVPIPDAAGLVTLVFHNKNGFAAENVPLAASDGEGGAGQIFFGLKGGDGTEVGNVHAFAAKPGEATLPPIDSVTLDGEATQCRWSPRTRVLMVSPTRSAMVIEGAGGSFTLRLFSYGDTLARTGRTSAASVEVSGGKRVPSGVGRQVYAFEKDGVRYRLSASIATSAPSATLRIIRTGKPDESDEAAGYMVARAGDLPVVTGDDEG